MACPIQEPSGTPATTASPMPDIITPIARVPRSGPAAVVATTAATERNAPVATAVTTREANTISNDPLTAATTFPTA